MRAEILRFLLDCEKLDTRGIDEHFANILALYSQPHRDKMQLQTFFENDVSDLLFAYRDERELITPAQANDPHRAKMINIELILSGLAASVREMGVNVGDEFLDIFGAYKLDGVIMAFKDMGVNIEEIFPDGGISIRELIRSVRKPSTEAETELPKVFQTDNAKKYLNRAVKLGVLDSSYKPNGLTIAQQALFIDKLCAKLDIKTEYKAIENYWGVKGLAKQRWASVERLGMVRGQKIIFRVFED